MLHDLSIAQRKGFFAPILSLRRFHVDRSLDTAQHCALIPQTCIDNVRTKMAYRVKRRMTLVALLAVATPTFANAQGVVGDVLFRQRCALCHAVAPGKPSLLAPNLSGVVGRKAGTTTFAYSKAMKDANIVWTRANLDKYLLAPTKMIAGTKMVIAVSDPKQRTALIDYLAKAK
jgi:cytochrome c